MSAFRTKIDAICAPLPGAEPADVAQGEHDAWKLSGKMFACMGSMDTGVSVKTDSVETASMLIDAGIGRKAPYFHKSWIRLDEGLADDELRHRLIVSYDLIRGSLTKKARAALPAREDS